jgi:hypothetical protein
MKSLKQSLSHVKDLFAGFPGLHPKQSGGLKC